MSNKVACEFPCNSQIYSYDWPHKLAAKLREEFFFTIVTNKPSWENLWMYMGIGMCLLWWIGNLYQRDTSIIKSLQKCKTWNNVISFWKVHNHKVLKNNQQFCFHEVKISLPIFIHHFVKQHEEINVENEFRLIQYSFH